MINAYAINKVLLMGRITADPELRQSQNGTYICRFLLAVDRGINQSTNERQTDFINVVAFDKNAEFVARYMGKGRLVLVEGNLKTGSYDDRNHPDVRHYTTDVLAERVSFGETKGSADNGQSGKAQTASPPQGANGADLGDFTEVISDDDIPF